MKSFWFSLLWCFLASVALLAESVQKINVVLILADDLGWSDLACYGCDLHETPHLDRLAGEQIRFNQAHAASPVCTPTRASILTGRHPARLNMTIWRENALNQKPRVVETPVTTCDLFPTILRSLEVAWPEDLVLDGVDVRSLWPNVHANLDRHALYFHYPHYYPTTTPVSSIRQGPWKLLEYYEDQTLELYHLTDDPGEIRNLVDSQPSVAERLRTQLKLWRESVSASMPEKNPHQP